LVGLSGERGVIGVSGGSGESVGGFLACLSRRRLFAIIEAKP
jgi:hypothetical protein